MNKELLLKIRREAITKWMSNHKITVHKFSDEPDNIEESLEIFAELIVKECINEIETYKIPIGNSPAGEMASEMTYNSLEHIRDNIRIHFGVK
jgi:hypothetical protein